MPLNIFFSTHHQTECSVSSTLSITTVHTVTNLPPACAESQQVTFRFPKSFMLATPPEACQGLYIRHLQRGSLCPSHVTGEHAEVMDRDRACIDLTHCSTSLQPDRQKTERVFLFFFLCISKRSFFRRQCTSRISISLVADKQFEIDKQSCWMAGDVLGGKIRGRKE